MIYIDIHTFRNGLTLVRKKGQLLVILFLPNLYLISYMLETTKKSRADATVPPTPRVQKDHAHSLGTYYKNINIEDKEH